MSEAEGVSPYIDPVTEARIRLDERRKCQAEALELLVEYFDADKPSIYTYWASRSDLEVALIPLVPEGV